MMERAKNKAQALGYEVIAMYLSPSHDAYIRQKFKKDPQNAVSAEHRVMMANLALKYHPNMKVSTREAAQPGFTDYTAVATELLRHYMYYMADGATRVTVLYVCGEDHYERVCKEQNPWLSSGSDPRIGLVVLPRNAESSLRVHGQDNFRSLIFFAEAAEETRLEAISSTMVRRVIRDTASMPDDFYTFSALLGDLVYKYIREWGLYDGPEDQPFWDAHHSPPGTVKSNGWP